MELILASKSPRRVELLKQITADFRVVPSEADESIDIALPPEQFAVAIAKRKAETVFLSFPDCAVLAADTIVVLDGKILGKPKDNAHAAQMLRALSGKTHTVITGVCFMRGNAATSDYLATKVTFNALTGEQIDEYVNSGLPHGKAGAYGVQDGYGLVNGYEGSYTNIVGLPLELVRKWLLTKE